MKLWKTLSLSLVVLAASAWIGGSDLLAQGRSKGRDRPGKLQRGDAKKKDCDSGLRGGKTRRGGKIDRRRDGNSSQKDDRKMKRRAQRHRRHKKCGNDGHDQSRASDRRKGPKGNNGVGNGSDPQPPGNPPVNDGPGTGPGNPGNKGGAKK